MFLYILWNFGSRNWKKQPYNFLVEYIDPNVNFPLNAFFLKICLIVKYRIIIDLKTKEDGNKFNFVPFNLITPLEESSKYHFIS